MIYPLLITKNKEIKTNPNPTTPMNPKQPTEQPTQPSTNIINSNKLKCMVDKLKLGLIGQEGNQIQRYRSVQIQDRSGRAGVRMLSYRYRNKTIQGGQGQDGKASGRRYQMYSSVSFNRNGSRSKKIIQNTKQARSSTSKQTITAQLRTYKYKNKLTTKSKVNSARQLHCREYNKLGVNKDKIIDKQAKKQYKNPSNLNLHNNQNPKKTRRYLTEIPTITTHTNNPKQQQTQTKQNNKQIVENKYVKQLRQTPLREQLQQISQIMQQNINTGNNYRDQLSILDNIGELDTILAKLQARQCRNKKEIQNIQIQMEKRFNKKKQNSIKKPTPIEPCLQNLHHHQHQHQQTNKQNQHIQSVPTLPSIQYQTILTVPTLQNQPSSEIYTYRPINIYENRNKKARNKLKQLKNNTLIMRSIDKIKHNFPKGFFYDTINQLQ